MELEPLRRYGFALDEATLKQLAYEKGITQSIESMTQAQKAQLRYVAILEQAGNIGVLGDMSRTIDTSANQLRILTARLQQLARAVGNMVMPVLSAMLPVITAFIQLLTEGAQAIAEFLGFELPRIDLNTSDVTQGYNNITDATNAATEATEKFKGSLAGVDQLNIIGSKTESGTGSGTGLNYDLDIDLPSYDFLNGVESKTKEIFEGIKKAAEELKPYLEGLLGVVIAIGAGAGLTKLLQFLDTAKGLSIMGGIGDFFRGDSGLITKATAGLAGGIANLFLWKKAAKDVTQQTENWGASLGVAIGGTVAIGAVLRAALGPIGYVITGVTLLGGALWGMNEAQEEARRKLAELIVYSNEGGISITALAEGFTDYFDTISSRYSDVAANTSAFESNKKAMGEAAGEIQNVTDKYAALGGEITAEDAEKIKANIETISSAIKENLGSATQDIVESLRTTFSKFVEELGGDVDDMIGKFYLLEAMGGSAITEYRKQADELTAKIMGGDTSAETMQQLNDVVLKMSAGMSGATEESTTFDRMVRNMDVASIDFENPEAVQAAFDKVSSAAEEARRSVESAWSGQTMELTSMRDLYESMGIDKQFDATFGEGAFNELFDMSFAAMDKAYQAELDKIDSTEALFTGMVEDEFNRKVNNAKGATMPTIGEHLGAIWNSVTGKIPVNEISSTAHEMSDQAVDNQFAEQREMISSNYERLKVENRDEWRRLGGELVYEMAYGGAENAKEFTNMVNDMVSNTIEEVNKKAHTITLPVGIEIVFGENNDWAGPMLAAIKEYAEGNPAGVTSSAPGSVYTTTRGDVLGSTTGIVEGQQGANSAAATEFEVVAPMPVYVEVDGETVGEALANLAVRATAMTNGK